MRVLLAFDKFKDALTAHEACEAAAEGLPRHPGWQPDLCPLTDGGDGFSEILTAAAGGHMIICPVTGPRGARVSARMGFVPLAGIPARALDRLALFPPGQMPATGSVAVVEMAAASGLALLAPKERDPWRTTSAGTGELIRTAVAMGACGIVLGVGGSATHDLGLGALAALGLEWRDARGRLVDPPTPNRFAEIAGFTSRLPPALPPIRLACDVSNPLLGLRGATIVFAPQKGLPLTDMAQMEATTARVARMLCQEYGKPTKLMETPGAGAAGGIAFGLMAVAGARLLSGFALVSEWLNLEQRVSAADLVITGEGCFDESSLEGKGPGGVIALARTLGKPVHVFAGQTPLGPQPANAGMLTLHTITPTGTPLHQALGDSRSNLVRAVARTFAAA